MHTLNISNCFKCPFWASKETQEECSLIDHSKGVITKYIENLLEENATCYPDWCPLLKEDFLIKFKR